MDPRPLDAVIGLTLRRLREQTGRRQEDVALAAQRVGLAWTRPVVASFERGTRQVQAGELILLPLLIREAFGLEIELADLVGGHGDVKLTPASTLKAEDVRLLLSGRGRAVAVRRVRASLAVPGPNERWDSAQPVELQNRNGSRRIVDLEVLSFVVSFEAEGKAARRLGVPRYVVALASWLAWNRPLSDEREVRVDAQTSPAVSPRTRQAIRGHVSRSLIEELRPEIEHAQQILFRDPDLLELLRRVSGGS